MQIWIYPADGTVAVDDMHVQGIDCSSIPTNVALVMWYGNDPAGHPKGGEILYNDRWSIREPFTDPTPYLAPINRLMQSSVGTYAAVPMRKPDGTVVTPKLILRQQGTSYSPPNTAPMGMSLSQAQTIQSGLIDGLFESKRQAPVTVGGQSYNGSDSDISAMSEQISAASQQVIDALHAEIAAAASSTNTALAGVKTNADNVQTTLLGTTSTANTIRFAISDATVGVYNQVNPVLQRRRYQHRLRPPGRR
jgi:hypothetical protein